MSWQDVRGFYQEQNDEGPIVTEPRPAITKVLFAITEFGTAPILWSNDLGTIKEEIEAVCGGDLNDLMGNTHLPKTPGIYFWEGRIVCKQINHPLDPVEWDCFWVGHWRLPSRWELKTFTGI